MAKRRARTGIPPAASRFVSPRCALMGMTAEFCKKKTAADPPGPGECSCLCRPAAKTTKLICGAAFRLASDADSNLHLFPLYCEQAKLHESRARNNYLLLG